MYLYYFDSKYIVTINEQYVLYVHPSKQTKDTYISIFVYRFFMYLSLKHVNPSL